MLWHLSLKFSGVNLALLCGPTLTQNRFCQQLWTYPMNLLFVLTLDLLLIL